MVLLHGCDYLIKLPQAPVFGGKLGFCNTGIGDREYWNGNYDMWVCRKRGIYKVSLSIKGLRQIN